MSSHIPPVSLGAQSNTDAQPIATKHQAKMYCCKYCSKHGKGMGARSVLYDVMDSMELKDKHAKDKFGEGFHDSTLGSKLHRAFMSEIGEEMCQAEVAHHANKSPEYLLSRKVRHVHFYRKALGLDRKRNARKSGRGQAEGIVQGDSDEEVDAGMMEDPPAPARRKRSTQPSDLDLYERRIQYAFVQGTPPSEDVPPQATPEEQVAEMNAFDFFRLVHFHGGQHPYFTWHSRTSSPIVILTPVVNLTDGAHFASGARWALLQYHAWSDRRYFLDMEERTVKEYFWQWLETQKCPWYLLDQYLSQNKRGLRGVAGVIARIRGQGRTKTAEDAAEEERVNEDDNVIASETEESSEHETDVGGDTRVLKMLYKGNMAEVSRREEQARKATVFNRKHNFYRHTRCTNTAQEEHSALPAGVINVCQDSDDDDIYGGEQKEIAHEMQELRAAQHWVNQAGWDVASEGLVISPVLGESVDLRLDWESVRRRLAPGAAADVDDASALVDEEVISRDYALDALDPTQRAFADRVLQWATEVARVYKRVAATGERCCLPLLRAWLGGSAGSGKSTTLKTIVQHVRLLFQRENIQATVALTAYTGVAAFNIGFGARTACSSFQVFPKAEWKSELTGEAFRRLEQQWRDVVLLIPDEVSFIGRALFARMHHRLQQAKRRFFSEGG